MRHTLQTPALILPVTERDHIRGPLDAPVTLVEYGDYECPHCAAAHDIVAAIQSEIGDRFRYVFRNFPLASLHPHAMAAAESAEAAGGQGKFWEMHDILFENQRDLGDADLLNYAEMAGIDLNRFEYTLIRHAHMTRIEDDFRSGVQSGVSGTPSFFINGFRHNGGYEPESLLQAILAESQ